jgi:Uma2 family endonuclease
MGSVQLRIARNSVSRVGERLGLDMSNGRSKRRVMSILEIDRPEVAEPGLRPELAGTLMSPEEFDAVGESDDRFTYELIHGVLVVTPPPLEEERGPNEELALLLQLYKLQHPQGAALDGMLSEQHVRTHGSRRRADRVIWAGLGRMPNPAKDVPTIVVEFVSEGKRNRHRDYIEKRAEYLASGVREYWIIDRFDRTLTACRQDGPDLIVPHDGSYRTPLLPGFELPLARLLEVADRWRAAKGS